MSKLYIYIYTHIYIQYIFDKTLEKKGNDEYEIQVSSSPLWKGERCIQGILVILRIALHFKQGSKYISELFIYYLYIKFFAF